MSVTLFVISMLGNLLFQNFPNFLLPLLPICRFHKTERRQFGNYVIKALLEGEENSFNDFLG
jgi:hypothetical protein